MAKTTVNKSRERTTSDELEVLREIIKNDPFLLDRVLSKIKMHRASSKQGIAESIAEKSGEKRDEERRKGSGT